MGRFCRAKAFIQNNNSADRLTASWFAIENQENERNVRDPELCSGLTSQYLALDRYCTYVVQTPRVERPIFLKQISL